ncbi:MAG TPA: hypothetical protein VLM11_12000 [Streptosporangiaceae bacterium]|nr:hypothetical protein [Streptosporangiaceae bacterium]
MDDVVAVAVSLADSSTRYFATWGRIQDNVDPGPVCEVVLRFASHCSLGADPESARLCGTLRQAADSGEAPYFYECFLAPASLPVPFAAEYAAWRAEKAREMAAGREIWYCGRPA